MIFWSVAIAIALAVAIILLRPLLRVSTEEPVNTDVALYQAQLAEIDRDLSRDILDAQEAERAKAEVGRRLLTAHKGHRQSTPSRAAPAIAAVLGAALLAASAALYARIGSVGDMDQPLAERIALSDEMRANRPDQRALEAAAPTMEMPQVPDDYLRSVEQLRQIMPTRPDDLRGWELLAFHEAELRQFASAAAAQYQIVRIKGDDVAILDRERLLDLMTLAADGYVSPEAEEQIHAILAEDDENMAARYHLGALYQQTDRSDIAFRLWRPLVESGLDTYHTALARAQIASAASRAGVDYEAPEIRGPSAADIAAAQDMSEDDRQSMIANMVAGLATRLAEDGGPPSDWARLISAYGVLGEMESAQTVWNEAQIVFAENAEAMKILRDAANSAGIAE